MPNPLACPACGGSGTVTFLDFPNVPVHQNLLFGEAHAAREAKRGDIALTTCGGCGFVFNAAFDPALLNYGSEYDNCQTASASFNSHRESIGRVLAAAARTEPGTIIEVGCGKGDFLKHLLASTLTDWTGVGLDPAYTGPSTVLHERIEYRAEYFPGSRPLPPADIVVSRHVIEHVPKPFEFVSLMTLGLKPDDGSLLAVETPCIEWTVANDAFWDITYEHCSLFSAHSLSALLDRAGCEPIRVEHTFGGQYLFATARPRTAGRSSGKPAFPRDWEGLLQRFASRCRTRIAGLRSHIREAGSRGELAVWGAAGKGTMFCNWLDPDGTMIHKVFDNNPNKWGKYLCGTGHPIVRPDGDSLRSTRLVIVMNSNYCDEIAAQARALNPGVEVVNAESLPAA